MKKIILLLLCTFLSLSVVSTEYEWSDGVTKHKVYIQKDKRIDFDPKRKGHTKIYKVKSMQGKKAVASFSKFSSPIFSDTPKGGGIIRALPGGIVVTFQNNFSDSDVKDWALDNKLEIDKKLNYSKENKWLFKSVAGMECLKKVEEIAKKDEVKRAKPDWWIKLNPMRTIPNYPGRKKLK